MAGYDDLVRGPLYYVMDYVAETVEGQSVADDAWEVALAHSRRPDELGKLLIEALLTHDRRDIADRALTPLISAYDAWVTTILRAQPTTDDPVTQYWIEDFTGRQTLGARPRS